MSEKTENSISREKLLTLGFPLEDYEHDNFFDEGERPRDRAELLLKNPGSELARENLYNNTEELDIRLSTIPDGTPNFDEVIKQTITNIVIENADDPKAADLFINSLDDPGLLFSHLKNTKSGIVSLSAGIKNKLNGTLGQLLTPRQLLIMEFDGLTHDLPKLLGGTNAQIDPDHEVIFKKVIGKYLLGKSFMSSEGPVTFNKDDVKFCVGLASFHEDIWREEKFARQTDSFKRKLDPETDIEGAVERARMIFHFIDIFGDAVGFDNKGHLSIKNPENFENRFVDLYRRHIRLPVKVEGGKKEEDWTRGKVTRAKWGLHGVAGLTWTFELLRDGWGIQVDPKLIYKVQESILTVLTEAENAANAILESKDTKYSLVVNDGQSKEQLIAVLKSEHKEIMRVKKLLESEMSE